MTDNVININEMIDNNQVVLPNGKTIYFNDPVEEYTNACNVHELLNAGMHEPFNADTEGDEIRNMLRAMNTIAYSIRNFGGKHRILIAEPVHDEHRPHVKYAPMAPQDFKSGLSHIKVQYFKDEGSGANRRRVPNGAPVPIGKVWLNWEHANILNTVVFEPGKDKEINGSLNYWRGFGFKPEAGDWSLLRNHVYDVLADGVKEHGDYVMKWAAFLVQHLNVKPEVALMFRGDKGTGKGTFAKALTQLLGIHGMHITSATHLTGRFNSHHRYLRALFVDEALAPDDKEAEAAIKGLATEDDLAIEAKGVDVVQGRNYMGLIIVGNYDHLFPATAKERRVAALHANDSHQQDHPYFAAIHQQLDNGGMEAMLYDLLTMDLGSWHPRVDIPRTSALQDQIIHSLKPVERFMLALLEDGDLPSRCEEKNGLFHVRFKDDDTIGRKGVVGTYIDFMKTTGVRNKPTDTALGTAFRELLEKLGGHKHRDKNGMIYVFAPLHSMRAAWDTIYGPYQWDDDDAGWNGQSPQDIPF